jgi:hypothetical protein
MNEYPKEIAEQNKMPLRKGKVLMKVNLNKKRLSLTFETASFKSNSGDYLLQPFFKGLTFF